MIRILLVDDEQAILEGLKVLFRRQFPHFEVVGTARDGREGVKAAIKLQPQIIITDVKMLRQDGLEMILQLQAEGVKAKFVLLSAFTDFQFARKAMHLGVRHYLTKPIEELELQGCLDELTQEIEEEDRLNVWAGEDVVPGDTISQIKHYILEHCTETLSLADLANRFRINLHYLSQQFKEKTGKNYLEFLTSVRMDRAKDLLDTTELRITEVSHSVGYADSVYFSRLFRMHTGYTPSEFRKAQGYRQR